MIVSTGNCFATVIKPNVITIYPDPVAAFNINNGINDNMKQTVSLTNLSTEERINSKNKRH